MARKSPKRSKQKVEEVDVRPMEPVVETVVEAPSGLTRLDDYYQEPEPEPLLTAAQQAAIREDAYRERFGAPVRNFREGVVARLNSKMRS